MLGVGVLLVALLMPTMAPQVSLAAPLPVLLIPLAIVAGPIGTLVIVLSLFCGGLVVFGRRRTFATWTLVLALVLGGLSAVAIWMSWDYGVRFQGRSYTIAVASFNVLGFGAAIALAELGRRSGNWWVQYAAFLALWVTLAWCAFPYLGEAP